MKPDGKSSAARPAPEEPAASRERAPQGPDTIPDVSQPTHHEDPPGATPEARGPPSADRYRIEEMIGVGGMGKVYRALDLKLGRKVALKFLRGGDAAQERRFLQEAQSQARVEHENVCKVFEVGRVGEEPYIAMQLVEGPTLADAAKEMSLRGRIETLRAIALGVQAAHREGLIHRDLKPANILLERTDEGGFKPYVTDFGLAREQGLPGNTLAGAIVGTPQYMAPEQARGEHSALDARTDIYALGAMLYELLSGRAPFVGGNSYNILYKLMHEEPAPPKSRDPQQGKVPAPLSAIALKCLAKNPARRYETARALADDLTRWLDGEHVLARAPSAPERARRWIGRHRAVSAAVGALLAGLLVQQLWPMVRFGRAGKPLTVAVADFQNDSGEEGLDGLSGMLITSLEQSRRLTVLTRSRMLDMLREEGRGEVAHIDEPLGRALSRRANADALLMATVRKFGELYQIDLKILEPRTSEYVLAAKAEGRGRESIPRLIDELSEQARRVLNDLPAREEKPLSPGVAQVTTPSLEAYQHYFRGEQLVDRTRFVEAAREFDAAVAIDKGFALAWYRLAYAEQWLHDGPRARAAADRALQLVDRLPEKEKLLVRAIHATLNNQGKLAYDSYKSCFDRFPQEKECAFQTADLLFHGGYLGYAIPLLQKALQLDPAMERALQHLSWAYQLREEWPLLLANEQQYVARVGTDEAWGHLARAYAASGDLVRARETLARAAEIFPRSALPLADLGSLLAWQGRLDEAEAAVKPLLAPERTPSDRALGWMTEGGIALAGGRARASAAAYEAAAREAANARDGEQQSIALTARGLVLALYLRSPEEARKLADDGRRLGIPDATFGFLYPFLGDLPTYVALLRGVGDPLADDELRAFEARNAGRFGDAADVFHAVGEKSPYRDFLYYLEGTSAADAGQHARASDMIGRAQRVFPAVTAPGPGLAVVFRARSELLLSAIDERRGERASSLEHTARFLQLWKDADKDLPELAEANARLARLRGAPPQAR